MHKTPDTVTDGDVNAPLIACLRISTSACFPRCACLMFYSNITQMLTFIKHINH